MPGFLLHVGATVTCAHGGQVTLTTPNPRLLVSAQPVVTTGPAVIAGCTLPPPPAANGPCVTAQYVSAAIRVRASGQAMLLMDSQAICAPTGTPLITIAAQTRVVGT